MSYKFTEMKFDNGEVYKFTDKELMVANMLCRANIGYDYLEMLVIENAFEKEEDLIFAKELMNNMEDCENFSTWCGGVLPKDCVKEYLDTALDFCRRLKSKEKLKEGE